MRTSLPCVHLARGVLDHQAAGMDLGRGIGDPPLDRLAVGQLLAEGHALLRVLAHHVERALRHADARSAHLQAADVSAAAASARSPAPTLAQHLASRHAAILEHAPRRCAGRPASGSRARPSKPGVPLSTRKAVMPPRAPSPVSVTAMTMVKSAVGDAADPDLAAVDHPVVAVLTARVVMPAGSPPAPGSEMAIAEIASRPRIGLEVLLALLRRSRSPSACAGSGCRAGR